MKIIIANWKKHPDTLTEAQKLFEAEMAMAEKYPNVKVIICPPTEFIKELKANGAQDVFWSVGENNFGVKYALVGHSDRRRAGDTDEIINQKLKIALKSGVTPILLIGEKEKGDDRETVIEKQLAEDLIGLTVEEVRKVLICYEPVWAISRPAADVASSVDNVPADIVYHPDTPESVLEAIAIINNFLITNYQLPITSCLYGGSVNQNNVADFLKYPQISGVVIGKASLNAVEFGNIIKIVSEIL